MVMERKQTNENERNKILVILIAILIVIIGLVGSLLKKLTMEVDASKFPQSTLTKTAGVLPEKVTEELLPLTIACPTMRYQISIPKDINTVNDKIVGTYEDMRFVICESNEEMNKMISSTLPNALNIAVIGRPHEVEIKVQDTGYCYPYIAEYVAMSVNTQFSVREVTAYAFVYRLKLESDNSLYIYVSTESKEIIKGAKDLLDKIACSVRPISENIDKEELQISDLKEEEGVLPIFLEKEALYPMENGVFLFEWMNVDASPINLEVIAPNGEKLKLMEEYSTNGHYVYVVGEMESGTYIIEGTTQEQISGVVMSIYEWDYYYSEFVSFGFE